jgi:Chalcone isomerase-like
MVFRALAVSVLFVGAVQAAELEGVELADNAMIDGQSVHLNGMALRTRYFFKVYVAGLYLPQKVSTAEAAFDARGAKRIVLVMMRDASAEQFCESIDAGLRANNSEAELEQLRPQTEALYSMIRSAAQARKGMRIVLDYAPSSGGTTLFVDEAALGPPMAGEEFFRALLRIWLGERPVQDDLKRLLLGQQEEN